MVEQARVGGAIDIARLLRASFQIYARRWRPHLGASLLGQLPVLVPTIVLIELLLVATQDMLATPSVEVVGPTILLLFVLVLVTFVGAFFFVLMGGAATQLVDYWLHGRRVTLVGAYQVALARFWRLAGAVLAVFAMIFGATVAVGIFVGLLYVGVLAAFGIDLAASLWFGLLILLLLTAAAVVGSIVLIDALVRWAVFVQAVIVEGAGPIQALARSAQLIKGRWWWTAAGLLVLAAVPAFIMMIVSTVLTLLLLPFGGADPVSLQLRNAVAIAVAQVLMSPLPAIGVAVLFYCLRDGSSVWEDIDARMRGR